MNKHILAGVLGYSPLVSRCIEPPTFQLWDRFAPKTKIDFVNVYGGPAVEQRKSHWLISRKKGNIGFLLDLLFEKALSENYEWVFAIEGDCFWLLEDFETLIGSLDNLDIILPNNRTGHLVNAPELHVQIPDKKKTKRKSKTYYYRPFGKTTPSNGILGMSIEFYKKFKESYFSKFHNLKNPFNAETLTYQQMAKEFSYELRDNFNGSKIVCLDAFVRANAWLILEQLQSRKGVLVNYDGNSFWCKARPENPKDHLYASSILETFDADPMPEIEGTKIKAPFFHLGQGTMHTTYLGENDEGTYVYRNYLPKLNDQGDVSHHWVISKWLIGQISPEQSRIMDKFQPQPNLPKSFIQETIAFYGPAFKDYL